jgi:superfamily II DNA or RNA helicase
MPVKDVINSLEFRKHSEGDYYIAEATDYFWHLWKGYKDELRFSKVYTYKNDNGKFVVKVPAYLYNEHKISILKPREVENLPVLQKSGFLKDFQVNHVRHLLHASKTNGNLIDSSETGIGKTYCSIATAMETGRPIFVITPKTVIRGWKKAVELTGIECAGIINYEALKFGNTEYLTVIEDEPIITKKGKTIRNITYKWNIPKGTIFIWDEIHRCRNYKSINAKMLEACVYSGYQCFGLSATIADNPQHLGVIGPMLKMFRKETFFGWMMNHGMFTRSINGNNILTFSGASYHLYKIHNVIYPDRGHRVTKNELGDLFPDNTIIAESYEMDNADKIEKVIKKMRKELRNLQIKKSEDVNEDHPLTIRLRARQEVELLKVPAFVELAEDAMEEGNSVIIFVNFRETLDALKSRLKTDCAIYGNQKESERNKSVDDFQAGSSNIIIVNIQAGGVGIDLHDTLGGYPRYVLVSPTDRSLDLVQCFGRAHRTGGMSKVIQKIIFAAGTVEEKVCENVNMKINNLSALNDGDLSIE